MLNTKFQRSPTTRSKTRVPEVAQSNGHQGAYASLYSKLEETAVAFGRKLMDGNFGSSSRTLRTSLLPTFSLMGPPYRGSGSAKRVSFGPPM